MANDTPIRISDQESRAFVLSAIALSTGVFNIAFWYGVFETVFFEHLFYIWVASSVALAASVLVPPVDALPALVSCVVASSCCYRLSGSLLKPP